MQEGEAPPVVVRTPAQHTLRLTDLTKPVQPQLQTEHRTGEDASLPYPLELGEGWALVTEAVGGRGGRGGVERRSYHLVLPPAQRTGPRLQAPPPPPRLS